MVKHFGIYLLLKNFKKTQTHTSLLNKLNFLTKMSQNLNEFSLFLFIRDYSFSFCLSVTSRKNFVFLIIINFVNAFSFYYFSFKISLLAYTCYISVENLYVTYISVDRYFAVTKPLRYKSLVTTFKIIVVIVCIWIFSFGVLLCTIRWDLEWSKNNYVS